MIIFWSHIWPYFQQFHKFWKYQNFPVYGSIWAHFPKFWVSQNFREYSLIRNCLNLFFNINNAYPCFPSVSLPIFFSHSEYYLYQHVFFCMYFPHSEFRLALIYEPSERMTQHFKYCKRTNFCFYSFLQMYEFLLRLNILAENPNFPLLDRKISLFYKKS